MVGEHQTYRLAELSAERFSPQSTSALMAMACRGSTSFLPGKRPTQLV